VATIEGPRVVLVDTNVLLDVVNDDPNWADWSQRQMRSQAQVHELLINPVIYTELSMSYRDIAALDRIVEQLRLKFVEIPKPALFLAGKAFLKYRQAGGTRPALLPDFLIGAHAAILNCAILTRDERRYRSYYARVPLITPTLQ
jgi:predicted nucleic acid-binding protein